MSVKGNSCKELRSANSVENFNPPNTFFDCYPELCSGCNFYCFCNFVPSDSGL